MLNQYHRINNINALFIPIPKSGIKCDVLFLIIKKRISDEPNYLTRVSAIFQFNITRDGEHVATYTCDSKSFIQVGFYSSAPKCGSKADVVLTIDDDDWVKIIVGQMDPNRALLMSKFTIKGDIILLQEFLTFWSELRCKGKIPELDSLRDFLIDETLIPGLKSEALAIEVVQRGARLPHLVDTIKATIQVNILKGSQLATIYSIELKPGNKPVLRRGEPPTEPDVTYTIEDDDVPLIVYSIIQMDDAIRTGMVKVKGKIDERARVLFDQLSLSSLSPEPPSSPSPPTPPKRFNLSKRPRLKCDICGWSTQKTKKACLRMHKLKKHKSHKN